jgi:hypothetical protein
MEDISRELEREIARSKPAPRKKSKKKRIVIVDDLGEMKSGGYLRYLLRIFVAAALVCLVAAAAFFMLFDKLSRENKVLASRVAALENQVVSLTRQKEILMARLVISGKDPDAASDIASDAASGESDRTPGDGSETDTDVTQNQEKPEKADIQADAGQKTDQDAVQRGDTDASSPVSQTTENIGTEQQGVPDIPVDAPEAGKVDIEKFSVTRDRDRGDLLVRFDIHNVSKKPGEVSGRIFTILKPQDHSIDNDSGQWLVVPSSPLDNGMPSHTKNGQYFSIAYFKPVKFRIKNVPGQAFFTTASIFIFNDQGELMFQSDIDIGEEDLG